MGAALELETLDALNLTPGLITGSEKGGEGQQQQSFHRVSRR
jgi:hypothetical protein